MKKIGFILSIFSLTLFFSNCDKNENNDKDLLIGNWKLSGIISISDEQKYLNTILEILNNNIYSNTTESGEVIVTGGWNYLDNKDYIQLSSGLFNDDPTDFRIIKNDSDSLILEEHYTSDGKDSYLEYHYRRTE